MPEPKKLLIIDDDADILHISKLCFDTHRIEVRCASSANAGLQEALQFQPDLILLDIMMPEKDGLTLVKEMQLIPQLATIPVIFFTAKAQKEEIAHYYSLGILGVIIKPFDPLLLCDQVVQMWQKSGK